MIMIEILMNTLVTVWLVAAIALTAAIPFVFYQVIYWAWKEEV